MKRVCLLALLFVLHGAAAAADPPRCLMTFDAVSGMWLNVLAACPGVRQDRDINGTPTLYISREQEVVVEVRNVNPLLYVATFGDVTLTDIDQVKDLAALFLQFGGLLKVMGDAPLVAMAKSPLGNLQTALRDVQGRMTRFAAQESAMLGALQRMEFEASAVCVPVTTDTLAEWTTSLAALRHAYDVATEPKTLADMTKRSADKEAADSAIAKAKAILEKERDLMKTIAATKVIEDRARAIEGAQSCSQPGASGYIVPRRIVIGTVVRDQWSKIATFPVKIVKQSPYGDALVTRLPDAIDTKFRLTSRQASLLGIGVGLTSSNIVSPTWTAATDPANPDRKVVTRTGEESRSAVKSLIASYAFTDATASNVIRPLVEFGASLESSKPGAFLGFGVAIVKYVRLGVGVTGQRVSALNGQTEGVTVVSSNDDIKTKSVWNHGWYWSFGFSLTGLPLFSRE